MHPKLLLDYRINQLQNGRIISIEITCCGKRIGEIRFKDGGNRQCPHCSTTHIIRIQHNHFHISQQPGEKNE